MMEALVLESPEQKTTEVDVQRQCDVCIVRGQTVSGFKFCLDCQESFCTTCADYHKMFKVSRHHLLIEIREISSLVSRPRFFTSFTKCPDHPEQEAEFHCKDHDAVFCVGCCNSTHILCNICIVSNHGTDDETRGEIEELVSQMRDALEHLNHITTKLEEIKKDLKKTRAQQCPDEVVTLTDNVAKLGLVPEVINQIELENENRVDEGMFRVSEIRELLEAKVALLDAISQHGSERQQFVSAHLMETQMEALGRKISEEDQSLAQIETKRKMADNYRKLNESADVEKLHEVTVNETDSDLKQPSAVTKYDTDLDAETTYLSDSKPTQVDLQAGKTEIGHAHTGAVTSYDTDLDAETTYLSDSKPTQVDMQAEKTEIGHTQPSAVTNYLRDSNLVLVEEHTVRPDGEYCHWFTGVSMYKNGRIILCDCNGRHLYLYNPANKTMLKLKLNRPCSATQIDDTRLAVSTEGNKAISIVTIGNELRVERTFKTQDTPKSIVALNNGQLAVAWMGPPAFGVIDISATEAVQKSYLDQDKNGRKFKSFRFLAVDEKRQHVIQPCNNDKAVYCFDFTGNPVFRYTNQELIYPRSVALDNVATSTCVSLEFPVVYTNFHQKENISIIKEGVPYDPYAICSDVTGTGLWVTQLSSQDKLVHFQLQHNTATSSSTQSPSAYMHVWAAGSEIFV